MSECVVRMKMPEGCFCCPIQGFKSHGVSVCGIGRKSVDRFNGKPDWCPIICQLPEGHGRLIDADALKENRWDADTRCGYVQVVDVGEIDNAPTIVPAEAESPSPKPTDPLPIRGVEYVPTEVDVQTGTVTYELRERSET